MKKVVTHGTNRFHTDDVFAITILDLVYDGQIEVTRSQDPEVIEAADIVCDIGLIYDHEKGRYDHHQEGGAGERENGVPYASIGLVWKHYGQKVCGSKEAADIIDKKLIQAIDAHDNGMDIYETLIDGVRPYLVQNVILSFRNNSNIKEEYDESFFEAVKMAKELLIREIKSAKKVVEAKVEVEKIYEKAEDKRLIIFDEGENFSDEERMASLGDHKEVLYIIREDKERGSWRVKTLRSKFSGYENRKDLPKEWGGKQNEELQEITGVKDAQFCHRGLFTCSALSKEGAIKMVKIALEN